MILIADSDQLANSNTNRKYRPANQLKWASLFLKQCQNVGVIIWLMALNCYQRSVEATLPGKLITYVE